jgi:hypothetical protein
MYAIDAQDEVTAIMMSDEEEGITSVRPLSLSDTPPPAESLATAIATRGSAALLAVEHFVRRESVMQLLPLVLAALAITWAVAGGALAATLVERLAG